MVIRLFSRSLLSSRVAALRRIEGSPARKLLHCALRLLGLRSLGVGGCSPGLLFLLCTVPAYAADPSSAVALLRRVEPTLARLSFAVPHERMATFEVDYRQKVVPFLKSREMVPHSDLGRPTAKGVFARLFVFPSVEAFTAKRNLLLSDPEWAALIVALGLGTNKNGYIRVSQRRGELKATS